MSLMISKGAASAQTVFIHMVTGVYNNLCRRGTSISSLMYVKEDLIIPHTVSFYDLIVQKARGKSGPLFHFDVHEDVRMQSDATVEKDESHAGAAE